MFKRYEAGSRAARRIAVAIICGAMPMACTGPGGEAFGDAFRAAAAGVGVAGTIAGVNRGDGQMAAQGIELTTTALGLGDGSTSNAYVPSSSTSSTSSSGNKCRSDTRNAMRMFLTTAGVAHGLEQDMKSGDQAYLSMPIAVSYSQCRAVFSNSVTVTQSSSQTHTRTANLCGAKSSQLLLGMNPNDSNCEVLMHKAMRQIGME